MVSNDSKKRAVGYSRTSGADKTSIGSQKEAIETYIKNNNLEFVRHYVDKNLSGNKIEGRDDFKRMLRDAANGEFDIIVVFDIDRFSRDGFDIIKETHVLRNNFGVDTVDTKGGFDTRNYRNTRTNFNLAADSQNERLRIMERCINGRIARAKRGLPWSAIPPAGRAFDKKTGKWYITKDEDVKLSSVKKLSGVKLGELLRRYADGESLKTLAAEFGVLCPAVIIRNVHQSQLSGIYQATFNAPDIDINELKVPVPAIPEIITPELHERVLKRLNHNRTWNKQHRKYLLTGFIKCQHCGRALCGLQNRHYIYYGHYHSYATTGKNCPYYSIRGKLLDAYVLNYLYSFFLDEPSYNEAVKRALPSDDDRKALVKDIKEVEKRIAKTDKGISHIVDAIAEGRNRNPLLNKLTALETEKQVLQSRHAELNQTLAAMPNPEQIRRDATLLRLHLKLKHKGKDWRKLPYNDVRKFLHFLFGDNPSQSDYGIFVGKADDHWHITFRGNAEFYHDVIDGRPVSHALQIEANTLNKGIKREYEQTLQALTKESVVSFEPFKDNNNQ